MGAKGGYRQIRAFVCTTCDEIHGKRQDAIECCDCDLEERRQKIAERRANATTKKFMGEAPQPRVRVIGLGGPGGIRVEATVRCNRLLRGGNGKRCGQQIRCEQSVYFRDTMAISDARAKMSALCRAQLSRHFRSCHQGRFRI